MRETGRYGTEAHLKKQVAAAGGETRKFVSPGRPSVPDQIVIWPRVGFAVGTTKRLVADIDMVETKAPLKGPTPAQEREHTRLRRLGVNVYVLNSREAIDEYVKANKP